jgi:hypothetical protein
MVVSIFSVVWNFILYKSVKVAVLLSRDVIISAASCSSPAQRLQRWDVPLILLRCDELVSVTQALIIDVVSVIVF